VGISDGAMIVIGSCVLTWSIHKSNIQSTTPSTVTLVLRDDIIFLHKLFILKFLIYLYMHYNSFCDNTAAIFILNEQDVHFEQELPTARAVNASHT
jgi:hypothetical protein